MDTCIYLDSDLVVEGDLSELFQIDIDGYFIGGVIDKIFVSQGQQVEAGELIARLKEAEEEE